MVDYQVRGSAVANFSCVLADWGAGAIGFASKSFLGGTPVYAGPRAFEGNMKDIFSFGRLALELFYDEQGTSQKADRKVIKIFKPT